MELSANGRRSVNSASAATKLGSTARCECQLSFALLFVPIRAFSAKRSFSNFRSNSRRAHGTISNDHRSVNFARIVANFDAVGKS
jgi:hypothetical protein